MGPLGWYSDTWLSIVLSSMSLSGKQVSVKTARQNTRRGTSHMGEQRALRVSQLQLYCTGRIVDAYDVCVRVDCQLPKADWPLGYAGRPLVENYQIGLRLKVLDSIGGTDGPETISRKVPTSELRSSSSSSTMRNNGCARLTPLQSPHSKKA